MKKLLLATTTPLASIFGSGFLVIVPILAGAVASWSVYAMLAICLLAFLSGEVIRFNIRHIEPVLKEGNNPWANNIERLSDLGLILAYIISVCLYLHILSAFVLNALAIDSPTNENLLTSAIIVFITIVGLIKGLAPLEGLEKWALLTTLVIIVILCIAFAVNDIPILLAELGISSERLDNKLIMPSPESYSHWEVLTILGGTLIVVQGFETSRYLGNNYDMQTRIRSSRLSQYIATVVYILFVALALPVVHLLNGEYNDHSLIALVGFVSAMLVTPLVLAAALSQFSAAVADTLAAAGNFSELSLGRITEKQGYLAVGLGAIALTWSVDTFSVLALASRAFALYYFLQCLVALTVPSHFLQKCLFGFLAIILGFITIFAVPVG